METFWGNDNTKIGKIMHKPNFVIAQKEKRKEYWADADSIKNR